MYRTIPPNVGHIILTLLHDEGSGAGMNAGVLADFLFH